ncbi:hypothetical protein FE257_000693 [Aspergillus nanangensis]|uniref:Virulence plasmid A protein n=1 Tax=Aspergillus nanangensis TaxID=2582783 RepID=A0AAD4CGD5_ASPNN|nr:hypothetical protein FE257_000693 [Aspergillus nanangensis]
MTTALDPQLLRLLLQRYPSLSAPLTRVFGRAHEDPRGLSQALGAACAQAHPADAHRLHFIDQLLSSTSQNLPLLSYLLADPRITSLRDVAIRACSLSVEACPLEVLCTLRVQMLGTEPTATLYGLLGLESFPESDEVRQGARAVMRQWLDTNIDISKDPIRRHLRDVRYFEPVPQVHRSAVYALIAVLQRLQAVVRDPIDVGSLLQASFHSAAFIACQSSASFVAKMTTVGLSAKSALLIYQQACLINTRNEQLGVTALRARNEVPLAVTGSAQGPWLAETGTAEDAHTNINLSNLFPSVVQDTACEDCGSVTSAAAYFVDMLHQLSLWPVNRNPEDKSLQDKLFERRSDLGNLQLSCANTNVVIPYIDLAMEALEAIVVSANPNLSDSYNMDDLDNTDDDLAAPRHVNYDVYEKTIAQLVFPMAQFPYNQAVDTMRAFVQAMGTSRPDLVVALCSEQRLIALASLARNEQSINEAAAVLDRFSAAEALTLQQEDYVAITHEAVQTQDFLGISARDEYQRQIGVQPVAAYWGYQSSDDMLSTSDTGTGLTLVKDQFLPRAEITFAQLLSLLTTSFVGQLLVIEMPDKRQLFSGKLQDMRLRQSFIRLWKKVQWTVEDTDAVITTLAGGNSDTGVISPDTITRMAGVQRLSAMATVGVPELLPLWGDINTNGPSSLYARLFLSTRLTPANSAFQPQDGKYLADPTVKLSDHRRVLQSALQLTDAGFDAIVATADVSDTLSLSNVSLVYRIALFCRLLAIRPEQYRSFQSLFSGVDLFSTPRATIDIVRRYNDLTSVGWSVDSLGLITQNELNTQDVAKTGMQIGDIVSTVIGVIASNTRPSLASDGAPDPKETTRTQVVRMSQILQPSFSDLDSEILQFMISEVLTVGNADSALKALVNMLPPNINLPRFDGYFTPPTTDMYTFITTDISGTPELYLDGVKIDFAPSTDNKTRTSLSPRRLVNGQSYSMHWNGSLKTQLTWQTMAPETSAFTPAMVLDQASVDVTSAVFLGLWRVSQLARVYQLEVDEIHYFQTDLAGFHFDALTLADIEHVGAYVGLRNSFPSHQNDSSSLLGLRKWLANPDDPTTIATRLGAVGGWDGSLVQQVLSAHYPGLDSASLVALFQQDNLATVLTIQKAMGAVTKLVTIPGVLAELLYKLAQPAIKPADIPCVDFANATEWRLAIHAQRTSSLRDANDRLRENQRSALVSYLLQQDFIRKCGITDFDGLYEHFLIDMQMGAGMKTSRLQLAISVVQLFVQRCMLGLERDNGVASTDVSRDDWEYMLRYRLWEANRKAFLYPENWIDSTLRDDKTEQFASFEASVIRTTLTTDSIEEALKTYIYASDEVADLEPLAYLWERRNVGDGISADRGSIHLFGRSRTTPYGYFYRRVDIRGPEDDMFCFWGSWEKLDVGIVPQEVDEDGRKLEKPGAYLVPTVLNGRLYLFLPHLTLKTISNNAQGSQTFETMSKEPSAAVGATCFWEMTMGWTELRNGKWTPKQVSQGVLEIAGAATTDKGYQPAPSQGVWDEAQQLPHIGSFRFWTNIRQGQATFTTEVFDILRVEVERWVGPQPNGIPDMSAYVAYSLGSYELRGQRLVLVDADPSLTWKQTITTDFMRLSFQVNAKDDKTVPQTNNMIDHGSGKRIYLTCSEPPKMTAEYTWTMSWDEINYDRPTGFLLNIGTEHEAQTVLGYPEALPDLKRDPYYDVPSDTVPIANQASPAMLETATFGTGFLDLFQTLSSFPKAWYADAFGHYHRDVYHEQADPNALYSWEIGVHAVSLLMERLQATGQYELALTVARCAFDPTIEGTDLTRCWLFPPFRDAATAADTTDSLDDSWADKLALAEWNANRASVHAAARGRPVAYMKRLAMKYIEILLDAGDAFFRQNTLEMLPLAMQRYIEASHVFGPAPVAMPELGKRTLLTYNQLAALNLSKNPNPSVDLELDFPFQSEPATRGRSVVSSAAPMSYIQTGYFCVPSNSAVIALKQRIDDRMYKIRNNLDLYGNAQDRALFEPPIDPGALFQGMSAQMSASAFAADLSSPMPKYRFQALIRQARLLTEELKSMESLILGIREKKDAEALLVLTTNHQKTVQDLVLTTKQLQKVETQKSIDVLQETRRMHETRLGFYLALTGDNQNYQIPGPTQDWEDIPQALNTVSTDDLRLTPYEALEIDDLRTAMVLTTGAASLDTLAATLHVVPQLMINGQPLGVGVSTEVGTGLTARALQATALSIRQNGDFIKIMDRQIEALQAQIDRCGSEIAAQTQEIACTVELQTWLQSKYTNEQLYHWLDNQYSRLYQDTYRLAIDMAQRVQIAYGFENPRDQTAYLRAVGAGYWDSGHDGLLAGATLALDLNRIEIAYMNSKPFDFEMEKRVSLRQLDPWALLDLRDKGTAKFSLSEFLFDMDFPGHYCRRIVSQLKATSSSSPCTLIDLSTDYASSWILFRDQLATGTKSPVTMTLAGIDRLLPFWTGGSRVTVDQISVIVQPQSPGLDLSTTLSIKEFDSVQWVSGTHSFKDTTVLMVDAVDKVLPSTWTVSVDNPQNVLYKMSKMWVVVQYTVG